MGAFYETIPQSVQSWILEQKMFWVATAPLSGSGHVNVSPKGGEYFGLIDEKTFWYMELTGSGCETLAHLYERGNGRITIMLCAFEGPPKIVRLWGKGNHRRSLCGLLKSLSRPSPIDKDYQQVACWKASRPSSMILFPIST